MILTYEDFVKLPSDGKRREIIDGELYTSPTPWTKHQLVLGSLLSALWSYFEEHRNGTVLPGLIDVVLSNTNIVEPDLVVILVEHASIITELNIQGVPDIVVEVISEATRRRDELDKRMLYERYGVPEYWIADPDSDVVKILRSEGTIEVCVESGGAISSPLLPGFTLDINVVFAE